MFKFLPWKFILRRAARSYGFLDPLTLMARLRSFAQPSEIQEPLELLRAGMIFHARGLVNTRAIQHNMDWIWPYWVERQFNPQDPAFIPRGFSFTHINLTHRNWTALGLPHVPAFPIVDPRGLITPFHDGWSLDFWIILEDESGLIPSKMEEADQRLLWEEHLTVQTRLAQGGLALQHDAWVEASGKEGACLHLDLHARADQPAFLAVVVRPYNPEGIQFIERITVGPDRDRLRVNQTGEVRFSERADGFEMARYEDGDVYHRLSQDTQASEIKCSVGMATAAALFKLQAGRERRLGVQVPLGEEIERSSVAVSEEKPSSWPEVATELASLQVPDERIQFLHDAAVRTLVLLSADQFYPGPYTYRRFWFRDACLMLRALLVVGGQARTRRILESFFPLQRHTGYFVSQEGEWDSNGQVLWILNLYERHAAASLPERHLPAIHKAVRWILDKRLPRKKPSPHAGLLPAGFSAEHLGPNDYYYWDDFWGVAGLEAAAELLGRAGQGEWAQESKAAAEDFRRSIEASLETIPPERCGGAMPASPYRRMDAGAVGSMVADYPLQLYPPGDPRIMATLEFLMEHCRQRDGFYQEMIHSGINAYLTLDLAQTLLRTGDERFVSLIDAVAALASPTGQWPEAIHPRTLGGCMGDGQHGWAAAEWVMMIRNCFIREEMARQTLIIGSGLFDRWLVSGKELAYGPTLTPWGSVTVRLQVEENEARLHLQAKWHEAAPTVEVTLPGFAPATVTDFTRPQVLERRKGR